MAESNRCSSRCDAVALPTREKPSSNPVLLARTPSRTPAASALKNEMAAALGVDDSAPPDEEPEPSDFLHPPMAIRRQNTKQVRRVIVALPQGGPALDKG